MPEILQEEKHICPICEKDIDVKKRMFYNLLDRDKDRITLSLELLIKGVCPICGYIVKSHIS
jgi:rubrerythrin